MIILHGENERNDRVAGFRLADDPASDPFIELGTVNVPGYRRPRNSKEERLTRRNLEKNSVDYLGAGAIPLGFFRLAMIWSLILS